MKNLLDKDKSHIHVSQAQLNKIVAILVWLTTKSQGMKPDFLPEDFFLTIRDCRSKIKDSLM